MTSKPLMLNFVVPKRRLEGALASARVLPSVGLGCVLAWQVADEDRLGQGGPLAGGDGPGVFPVRPSLVIRGDTYSLALLYMIDSFCAWSHPYAIKR